MSRKSSCWRAIVPGALKLLDFAIYTSNILFFLIQNIFELTFDNFLYF